MAERVIRVMLIDDHAIVLEGLRAGLSRYNDIEVVATALHCAAALKAAEEMKPNLALVDLALPGIGGFETAQRLRQASPSTRVVFLSGTYNTASIERALDMGASGFLLKTEPPVALAKRIREAMQGDLCFSRQIQQLVEPGDAGYRLSVRRGAKLALLSAREREMLKALAEGCALKQAALRMDITYKSADHLKAGLMKKLDIHDRSELTRFAIQEGVLSASPDNLSPTSAG